MFDERKSAPDICKESIILVVKPVKIPTDTHNTSVIIKNSINLCGITGCYKTMLCKSCFETVPSGPGSEKGDCGFDNRRWKYSLNSYKYLFIRSSD